LELVIQNASKEVCAANACRPLVAMDGVRREYHCHGADPPCLTSHGPPVTAARCEGAATELCLKDYAPFSTAGPFVYDMDIRIDLASRTFEGIATGAIGDRSARPYVSQFSGVCRPKPKGA
jgi:hypothetical protein